MKLKINGEEFNSPTQKITGSEILELACLLPSSDYELLKKVNEKGFVPIQPDEIVDLKEPGIEGFKAKPYKKRLICVDEKEYEVSDCFMTPNQILELAGLSPSDHSLIEVRNGGVEIGYKNEDLEHKVAISNGAKFNTCPNESIECIIVQGREKPWVKSNISFMEVVQLAFGASGQNASTIYTITYNNGVELKPAGSMVKGKTIPVKNKMSFNVTCTNKS